MAKEIYFVRHGLTVANEADAIQDFNDPLSEHGRRQAEFLAERLSRIAFNKMLASDMLRTRQTAEIVAAKTGHEVEFSALYREVQYPAALHGLSRGDPQAIDFRLEQQKYRDDPSWKSAEEESVSELIERISAAFEYAANQPEESVVVITHGQFLRKLILLQMVGKEDAPRYWGRDMLLATANTGITLLRKEDDNPWRLITWNDHAHLG